MYQYTQDNLLHNMAIDMAQNKSMCDITTEEWSLSCQSYVYDLYH